jgi:hypothetical protein
MRKLVLWLTLLAFAGAVARAGPAAWRRLESDVEASV